MSKPIMISLVLAAAGAVLVSQGAIAARNNVEIVGSSTVYPFATVVAERYGKRSRYGTPKIESTGSGGGFKLFCGGVGVNSPDITNASRRMKKSELEKCRKNGVKDVVEVKIGYDGIVIANSKKSPQFSMNLKDIFLALAKDVPDPAHPESGNLIPNPYRTWNQVDPVLPNTAIEVIGPPPTSGTRDAFVELAMEGGCKKFGWIKAVKKSDKHRYKSICHTIREDGAFIEAGENDNLIVQKLEANPAALGIFGYSFLEQNEDKVQGSKIEGITPEFDSIASGSYPVSRPLFFYVKKAHVGTIPGIKGYLDEFTSERAWGDEGYLADKGLIPMPNAERKLFRSAAMALRPLTDL